MRLGMLLKYSGAPNGLAMDEVLEAERLGYDSVWSGEAYGTDAVTPTAWILARTTRIRAGTGIMQMQARTPACTAMTAMTLQALSNNRFLLGHRRLRAAGRRGLARRAVRQADGAHPRIHPDPAQDPEARGSRSSTRASSTRSPTAARARPGSASRLKSILHGDPDMPI